MTSLPTLICFITESLLCPRTGACDHVQDLMQSTFERKGRQISLPPAAKGVRRFSKCADAVIYPSLSMIRSCRSVPWLNIALRLPPLPLGLAPIPFLSNLLIPSSFCAGLSTHTGVEFNHSPLSAIFWSSPHSARAPNRHRGRGVGGPSRVWGDPEKVRERGVVKFDAGMGGSASADGGGTPEIRREQFWRKAKRRGRRMRHNL